MWSGLAAFLAHTVPFVTEALDDGVRVMVAVPGARWAPLREALGRSANRVRYVDMAALGRNPARILPVWIDFIAENGGGTRPLRGIGEPIWAGRRHPEVVECQLHEVMLNLAVPADVPLWLLCPYDVENLPAEVIHEARRSHPAVAGDGPGGHRQASPATPQAKPRPGQKRSPGRSAPP